MTIRGGVIQSLHAEDHRVRGIRFSRNFGHQVAVHAGIKTAVGEIVVIMDADGQDPPELLPDMIALIQEGNDVVNCVRQKRKESALIRGCYYLFYRLYGLLVPFDIPLDSGDFCAMNRKTVDVISAIDQHTPFIRGIRSWAGGKQVNLEYERQSRQSGETKYSLRKLILLTMSGITAFSKVPLRFSIVVGLIVSGASLVFALVVVVMKLLTGYPDSAGWASLATLVALLGGAQLTVLEIIGEYLGHIFDSARGMPAYQVEEVTGFSGEGEPEAEPGAETEVEDDGTVALNLNNVDIQHVITFLGEITGLPVIKQKDVNVQLSVISPTKVSKEKAFALITEALLLEKIAVVRNQDSVRVIPLDRLSDVVVDLLPSDTDEITGGIVKTVIPIRFANVAEIEKIVKELLSSTGSLLVDPSSKKIIVTDSARRVRSIKDVVTQLDVLNTDQRQVKIFELKHADPNEWAPILKSVLGVLAAKKNGQSPLTPQQQQQQQQRQQGGQPQSGGGGVLDVVPFKSANWLVVVAPQEILAAAIPLVEEFDREKPKKLFLHTLPVQYADVREVARELTTLFQKQPQKRVQDIVVITADERSSTLMILSSNQNYEQIKNLVGQLDTQDSVKLVPKTYKLKYADATDIAEQMNELYTESTTSRYTYVYYFSGSSSQPKTRFVAERRTNSIIAIARPSEFEKIESLIEKLDTPLDPDQVTPRIFRLKYIDAREATTVLNEVFGVEDSTRSGGYYDYLYGSSGPKEVGRLYGKVRFVTETTTNSIIVTTNNVENFIIIRSFIEEMDTMGPDAGNTIVVRLQHADARKLSDQLNALLAPDGAQMPQQQQRQQQQGQNQQQQQQQQQQPPFFPWLYGGGNRNNQDDKRLISNLIGQVRIVPDTRTNSLTISTASQNFQIIQKLILELDIPSPKVLVRVRLIEITTTEASRIGTRFTSDTSILEPDDFDNGILPGLSAIWAEANSRGSISASAGVDIGVLIQFLSRNADTRILATPTLTMNNNETGDIFVGSRIPFITNSQTTPEGSLNQSFEYRDAGITLKVTPNVNELDKVEMKIELEASQIRPGEVLFGGFFIDTRKFNTEIAVNSGDTIVIGGILREIDSKGVRRVPVLGRIPILNLAFSKKDSKREVTELIAFITPTVLRDADADAAATQDAIRRFPNIQEWQPLVEDGSGIIETPKKGWKKWRRSGRKF